MNKICTSLEQSKRLVELGVDVNTADMCYCPIMNIDSRKNEGYLKVPECYSFYEVKDSLAPYLPAWSLTALLELIPNYVINKVDDKIYANLYYGLKSSHDNLVDVAFEMICQLKENKEL